MTPTAPAPPTQTKEEPVLEVRVCSCRRPQHHARPGDRPARAEAARRRPQQHRAAVADVEEAQRRALRLKLTLVSAHRPRVSMDSSHSTEPMLAAVSWTPGSLHGQYSEAAAPGRRLFLYLAFQDVHGPSEAPERFLDVYDPSTFAPRRKGLAQVRCRPTSPATGSQPPP